MGDVDNTGMPATPLRWQQLVGELSSLYEQTHHRATRLEHMELELEFSRARNEELEKRVKDLEREVQVWRQAHERECAAKEAMANNMADLHKEIGSMKEDTPLVVCLIDGDGTIFAQDFLVNGQEGGRLAARALHRGMLEYLGSAATRAVVCATVYCNRMGLREALSRNEVCSHTQFDAFWIGFSQAASMFQMVDVGPGKEAADAKLREALRVYSRMPQTMRVFFGGAHDGGYRPPLQALALDNSLDKVVLIQAYDEIAYDLRVLNLHAVRWDGLFMAQKIGGLPGDRGPLSRPDGANAHGSPHPSGSSAAPNSPGPQEPPPPGMRYIDPTIPIGKNVPPPCNFHYLLSNCMQGVKCPYGHNYILTPQQLAALRKAAKKAPCFIVNRNQQCPFGDKCCMSHRCPHATNCAFVKAGKCKWSGRSMHDPSAASHG
ncbi:hypothetical protein EXIGLDRAFT_640358 [Exidia glandulosa HHB12029]|uniref:C3H1-type domain-containing protein n=1 Tax=Exidia glandulosa HHB12029 TaxID=1314781 RepID=A0A165MR01_EXIGL|nr:hypothetical protein EXIGLDRAFT_640358 [Exidia glandulosa HHB12029]